MSKEAYIVTGCLFDKRGYHFLRASWYDEDGTRHQKDKNTHIKINDHRKREAKAQLDAFIAEIQAELDSAHANHTSSLPFAQQPFLAELEAYMQGPLGEQVRPNTHYEYCRAYERYIRPYPSFAGAAVGDVTPQTLDEFRDSLLARGLSANSVNKVMPIMRQFFTYHCYRHELDSTPFTQFRPPKAKKFRGQNFLTTDELRVLRAAAQGTEIEAAIELAVALGLRKSEICGLRWEDIDWQRKQIHKFHFVCHFNQSSLRSPEWFHSNFQSNLPLDGFTENNSPGYAEAGPYVPVSL